MDHTQASITEKIVTYINDNYNDGEAEDITPDYPLISSGLIDSVSTLVVVEFLEKSFDFEFEPHEVDHDNLDTVNKMVAFVLSKTS